MWWIGPTTGCRFTNNETAANAVDGNSHMQGLGRLLENQFRVVALGCLGVLRGLRGAGFFAEVFFLLGLKFFSNASSMTSSMLLTG